MVYPQRTVIQTTLYRPADGSRVLADLGDAIWDRNIHDYVERWRTHPDFAAGPTASWDWQLKRLEWRRGEPESLQEFALEAEGETQGLMLVSGGGRAKSPTAAGKDLLYVCFLEAAPWNRGGAGKTPRLTMVGTRLMLFGALLQSHLRGYNGRVGLSSIPEAKGFYRNLGMTELGSKTSSSLTYFEWDETAAETWRRKLLAKDQ